MIKIKKIVIITLILMFLTGCSDYKELENLATITSIGVDYVENEYKVTYEVLNNKKENDKVLFESYTISATGKSVSDAFIAAAEKIKAYPYFAHVELFVMDEEIAKNHFKDLVDFLLRENEIRENFFMGITDNSEKLLNSTQKLEPVISFAINKLVDVNRYSKNIFPKITLAEFIANNENYNQDNILPYIEYDDSLEISKLVAFQKYQAIGFIDKDFGYIYSLLNQKNTKYYINHFFDTNIMEIGVTLNKKEIEIDNNRIIININVSGSMINNETNFNLKNPSDYSIINNTFKDELTNRILGFINYNKEYNTDLLGIKNQYFIKKRDILNDSWTNLIIDVKVQFELTKKGIIYDSFKK